MSEATCKLESIGNGIKIYTSAEHPFGTDAILLADFSKPKKNDTACDLGSGCGIIPFLWARYDSPGKITAVEIQQNGIELIKKSICLNRLEGRIDAVRGDLRQTEGLGLELGSFSLVTMNPPYFSLGSGFKSENESQKYARHELSVTTEDIMKCASKLLKYSGRLCICQKPERLPDIICEMRKFGIEPKRLRFVCGKEGKEPYLFLIEGRKGSGKQLNVLPELCVRNADGSWSTEMLKIYGDYGDGTKK